MGGMAAGSTNGSEYICIRNIAEQSVRRGRRRQRTNQTGHLDEANLHGSRSGNERLEAM